MFNWLRRIFRESDAVRRQRFLAQIDAANAEIAGGEPVTVDRVLGSLKLRSGMLVLGDPQCVIDLEVPNVAASEAKISASLWKYPSGAETVTALKIALGVSTAGCARRQVGKLGIDSAKVVVADRADLDEHWTDTGKDRIGVISTAPDDTLLRLLTKRFKLKTVRVNAFRAEVIGPVSEHLAADIEAFLKADPKYADFAFFHFRVQTNNSFDRANYTDEAWQFMPVGNDPAPLMFVCGTGRGDGSYDVYGQFDGDIPRELSINFIEE